MSSEELKPSAPVPYGALESENTEQASDSGNPSSHSDRCPAINTKYIRSIEGILKLISIPVAIVGMIVTSIAVYYGPSGWYYFVGIGYLIYVTIVIVIETFVPHAYIHRIIDAIVVGVYGALWGTSAIVNTVLAAVYNRIILGVASIFAYLCFGLCVLEVVFAIHAWRRNGNRNGGSEPLCGR